MSKRTDKILFLEPIESGIKESFQKGNVSDEGTGMEPLVVLHYVVELVHSVIVATNWEAHTVYETLVKIRKDFIEIFENQEVVNGTGKGIVTENYPNVIP